MGGESNTILAKTGETETCYMPSSILAVRDYTQPLAYGMPDRADVFSNNSAPLRPPRRERATLYLYEDRISLSGDARKSREL